MTNSFKASKTEELYSKNRPYYIDFGVFKHKTANTEKKKKNRKQSKQILNTEYTKNPLGGGRIKHEI